MARSNQRSSMNHADQASVPPAGGGGASRGVSPTASIGSASQSRRNLFPDIASWAGAYSHMVCSVDSLAIDFCRINGIPFRSTSGSPNPHSISHICRDEVVRVLLMKEGRNKQRLRILDWFGGSRNLKFDPSRNGPYGKTEDSEGKLVPSNALLEVEWVIGPPDPIAGDVHRVPQRSIVHGTFDFVLTQDVYHDGSDAKSPFTPATILKLSQYSSKVYVSGRIFLGFAGYDELGVDKFEQVFYRDEANMIVSSPDPQSPPYPSHPDINWVFQNRSIGGVDIVPLSDIGPFKLSLCSPMDPFAQKLGVQKNHFGDVEIQEIRSSDYYGWKNRFKRTFGLVVKKKEGSLLFQMKEWLGFSVEEKLPVHMKTYVEIGMQYSCKMPNGQILDSLIANINSRFSKDRAMMAISSRFPSVAAGIRYGTATACLYGQRVSYNYALHATRSRLVDSESKLTEMRATAFHRESHPRRLLHYSGTIASFALLGACIYIYKDEIMSYEFRMPFARRPIGLEVSYRHYSCAIGPDFETGTALVTTTETLNFHYISPVEAIAHLASKLYTKSVEWFWSWKPACVFEDHPYFSLVFEELMGMHPWTNFICAAYELLNSLATRGISFAAFKVFLFHLGLNEIRSLGQKGRLIAVSIHLVWNLPMYFSEEGKQRFELFRKAYEMGNTLECWQGHVVSLPADTMLPSLVTRAQDAPQAMRGSVSVYVDNVEVDVPMAFDLLREGVGRNQTFPILITHRLLFQPANVEANLLAAILFRIHSDPFVDCPYDEEKRHANWKLLSQLVIGNNLVVALPDVQYSLKRCTELMGTKGKRIQNAFDALNRGEIISSKKTINLKWNETLSANKNLRGISTLKPRAIQNLEPHVHALMAPYSRAYADILHNCFSPENVHSFEGKEVRIVFAAGYTGEQLTNLANELTDGIFTVVVSGDDSIVSFGKYSRDGFPFAEADQSQFDHTQDDGPCKIFQGEVQKFLGLPDSFTRLAYECCSSGYYARRGRLFVKGHGGTQMPTGITVTTSYNSFSTICFWLWWLKNEDLTVEQAGQQLGFKVKYFPRLTLEQATFLKGWWMKTVDDIYVWRPLPSACIKLGKMIRDPVEITHFVRNGKKMKRPRDEAIAMCAYALASSYNTVGFDYPIFGAFLDVLRRFGRVSTVRVLDLLENEKPTPSAGTLDWRLACEQIEERYGITISEIEEVSELFYQVKTLPSYVEHPVFDKLVEVDY